MDEVKTTGKVVEASEVFLSMSDNHRISRNSRAAWYFSHLNQTISLNASCTRNEKEVEADFGTQATELSLLSVVPAEGAQHAEQYRVTSSTKVTFIAQKYRLVFVLDLSPSVVTIDPKATRVIYDVMFRALSSALKATVQPFKPPGSDKLCCPKLFVTVMVHTSLLNCNKNNVLLQGCLVNITNVDEVLMNIRSQLSAFESHVAKSLAEILGREDFEDDDDQMLTGGLFEDIIERPSSPDMSHHVMSPEACFINMLRSAILALHLLPDHASAGIIVLTDGITCLPDVSLFEALMMQLRHSSIACSFMQLTSLYQPAQQRRTALGHIPYPDLLHFIASATFGACFTLPDLPLPQSDKHLMNIYHKALLCWDFRKALSNSIQAVVNEPSQQALQHAPGSEMLQWTPPLGRKKLFETGASIGHLISCRLREGYTIKDVHITKNDTQLEVRMVLPWRHGVNIQYLVVSVWPINPTKHVSQVEVSVEAGYEFRHDVAFASKKEHPKSTYRNAVVKKFWQTLTNMMETDRLLVHLQSFNLNPTHYSVPDCVLKGVPLFCLAANSNTPQPNTQLNTRELTQFINFWKPVLLLDVGIWQKWLHSHKIGMILEHDLPHVPKHLHVANSSGRFASVSCRQSLTALQSALQQLSSFVLLDNHTYVVLRFEDQEKPPVSMHLIRLSSKPPCVVLRIAFIGGTPGKERNKILKQLKERLEGLRFSGSQVEDKSKVTLKIQRKTSVPELHDASQTQSAAVKERRPPLQRDAAEINCCKIMLTPVEKILIRYDRMPLDFTSICPPTPTDQPAIKGQGHMTPSANLIGYSNFTILSRYLYHHRWIWSVQLGTSMPSMHATGNILSNLTKMRLQEGFNIAQTQSGIVTLVAEVNMKGEVSEDSAGDGHHPCVIQYLIFPPHTTTSKDSSSIEDDDEGYLETTEADGELQLITECWIEPQHGVVAHTEPESTYLHGLNYTQIPQAIYPRDLECVSSLITFEHLNLMCQNVRVQVPSSGRSAILSSSPEAELGFHDNHGHHDNNIQQIPFPFDLLRILPKSQQVELLFSTLLQSVVSIDESVPSELGGHSDHLSASSILQDESNKQLYSLFLDEMRGVHDREVPLSQVLCDEFLHLLSARGRDVEKHPYPFVPPCKKEDILKLTAECLSDVAASGTSLRQSISVVSGNSNVQPSLSSTLSVISQHNSRTASPLNVTKDAEPEESCEPANCSDSLEYCQAYQHVPQWCCFVKSVSSTHILLLFMPASFTDLKLLLGKTLNASPDEEMVSEVTSTCDTEKLSQADVLIDEAAAALSSGDTPAEQPDVSPVTEFSKKCYKLPIYVYNCPVTFLDNHLVNHWTYERPADIYQDLTFKTEPEITNDGRERRTVSESERRRSMKEGVGMTNAYSEQEDLEEHCTLISEIYLRCFVMGVYQSLRVNHSVDPSDVDFAVNSICEEHIPLEIDISQFLQVMCGHLRTFVDKYKLDKMIKEDIDQTLAVSSMECSTDTPDDHDHDPAFSWTQSLPDSVSAGQKSLCFPLIKLDTSGSGSCEAESGLHELVGNKFLETLHKYFRPVPDKMDLHYFCPDHDQLIYDQNKSGTDMGGASHGDFTNLSSVTDDTEMKTETVEAAPAGDVVDRYAFSDQLDDKDSVGSVKDLSECSESSEDDGMGEDAESNTPHPLFLQLTCSVRSAGGGSMRSMTVEKLPTCLGELRDCLDLTSELDLCQSQVTIDMIFLTLPPKEDIEKCKERPCYNRLTSYTSVTSHMSSPGGADLPDGDVASSMSMYGVSREISDTIGDLPACQLQCLSRCKEKIHWLLTDEISSALRLTLPVTAQTLEIVANHVKNTTDQPGCMMEEVPLKFVYGPEKSLALFIEDFGRIHPPGYRLKKEGLYYYLYVDPVMVNTMAHAHALSSALQGLEHQSDSPPVNATTGDLTEATLQPNTKLVKGEKSEGENIAKSPRSPSNMPLARLWPSEQTVDNQKLENAKALPVKDDYCDEGTDVTSSDLMRKDATESKVTEKVEGEGQTPEEKRSSQSSDLQETRNVIDTDGDNSVSFSSKAIKISVIRPSPVKEVNRQGAHDEEGCDDVRHESDDCESKPPLHSPQAVERQLSDDVFKDELSDRARMSSGDSKADQGTVPAKSSSEGSSLQAGKGSNIKRVKSSASFEKYKSEKVKSSSHLSKSGTPRLTSTGGVGTPQRRLSGQHTPKTSQLSGMDTPLSAIDTGSRCSGCDDGYDGGSSDSDEDGAMMSYSESRLMKQTLPKFWLILRVTDSALHVYFHTRDYGEQLTISADEEHTVPEIYRQMELYKMVITEISRICHTTNQKLLLDDLYGTRMCNSLLVPEADEDVRWTPATGHYPRADSEESDTDSPRDNYLAAKTQFKPGFFACEQVWCEKFTLHPRLKAGSSRAGSSVGIQALKTVLNKFSVSNRKNLFVYKENSGAVFYLRLSEACEVLNVQQASGEPQTEETSTLTHNRKPSISSVSQRKLIQNADDSQTQTQKTLNSATLDSNVSESTPVVSASRASVSTAPKTKVEVVTLSAHGISDVGKEVKVDLVQLLQRKLDDAVLDMLTLTLSRNPMCKLTTEDVTFIQQPHSSPASILMMPIPSTALNEQYALRFYLRQNLLHIFYTPKYMENALMFSVWDNTGKPEVIPQENIFLYNKTQQSGGKVGGSSIACVQLSFVDGRGTPIEVIPHPKPSMSQHKEIDSSQFEGLVATSFYEPLVKQKGPGPVSLVQYSVWERGQVDMSLLREKLAQVTTQAVCDVVMEYHLLPAPLCVMPDHQRTLSPVTSAPLSPASLTSLKHTPSQPSGMSVTYTEPSNSKAPRTPKEKSSLSSLMSYLTKSSSVGTPKEADMAGSSATSTGHEADYRTDLQYRLDQYEAGERGTLLPIYHTVMKDWLDFSHTVIGSPLVSKSTYMLLRRFPIDYILKELPALVKSISHDTNMQVFRCAPDGKYHHYVPARTPVTAKEDRSESSLDLGGSMSNFQLLGSHSSYIAVGRNMHQWRSSIDYTPCEDESVSPIQFNFKSSKTLQRFRPYECGSAKTPDATDKAEMTHVPRQRLALTEINDKKLMMLTYNWSGDCNNSLERQMCRLVQWHNARSHLLHCIIGQKMGLFWHHIFAEYSCDIQQQQEVNPFTSSSTDFESLIKNITPTQPQPPQKSRHRSGSIVATSRSLYSAVSSSSPPVSAAPALTPALPVFDEMYRELRPLQPMHKSSYANLKDPIHRHGAQFLELRSIEKKEREKKEKLVNVYLTWQQRLNNRPIAEDVLDLLKSSSRLIHCVSSPLLFSPKWRRHVLGKPDPPQRQESHTSDTSTKSRSRHGSGTSVKSKRSDSLDSRQKKPSGSDSTDLTSLVNEELWHVELKEEFIRQYVQYLQSIGFAPIQISMSDKRNTVRSGRQSGEKKCNDITLTVGHSHSSNTFTYLQKTFPGGIMLIEIGFQEVYFTIHVYALESSRLPISKTVNTALAHIFTDECDRFKDLTHVHSFTHDFHLRTIQAALSPTDRYHLTLKKHYNVTAFLQDFVEYYPYCPSFARNYVLEGTILKENTNSSGQQLFEYLLKTEKLHGMRPIRMTPLREDEDYPDFDNALVMQLSNTGREDTACSIDPNDYNVGLVVHHDAGPQTLDKPTMSLHLKYWIIVTNKREHFPMAQLEKKLGLFKPSRVFPAVPLRLATSDSDIGTNGQTNTADLDNDDDETASASISAGEISTPLPVTSHIGVRQEPYRPPHQRPDLRSDFTNYLGFSAANQTPALMLLRQESARVRDMLNGVVEDTVERCRRDLLWHRMLLTLSDDDDRKRRPRASDEDSRDAMPRLTFNEFQELLNLVIKVQLSDIDPNLSLLQNLSSSLYPGLITALSQRFPLEKRHFTSSDGLRQHVVVLNPNYLDTFLMLSVDLLCNTAEVCAVYKDEPGEEEHTPSNPNLPLLATQTRMETFVNTCSYYLWSSLL